MPPRESSRGPALARQSRPVALRRLAAHLSRQGFSGEVVAALLRERFSAAESPDVH